MVLRINNQMKDPVLKKIEFLRSSGLQITNSFGAPNPSVIMSTISDLGITQFDMANDCYVYLLSTIDSISKNMSNGTYNELLTLGDSDLWKHSLENKSLDQQVDFVVSFAKKQTLEEGWNLSDVDGFCWFLGQACIAGASANYFDFKTVFLKAYKRLF